MGSSIYAGCTASTSCNAALTVKGMCQQREKEKTNNDLFRSIEKQNYSSDPMKSRTKIELARAAGVSPETFRRWLKTDHAFLEANNIRPTTKLFPPKVVKYLCEKYCIEIE